MDRHIPFARLHNFRDMGGYSTKSGEKIRSRLLFRSDSLSKLQGADLDRFLGLGIGTVIDLRYPWEISAKGRVPEHPSFVYHNLSVEHRPYDQASLGPEIETGPYLAERYGEVAKDGVAELRAAIELIATSEGPVAFHCASGKDRTGLLAALILDLLAVPERTIVEDFALTRLATPHLLADWLADHPGQRPSWPGYGTAPTEVMTLFLAGLRERHGSVHQYLSHHVGVDADLTAQLRRKLLEPVT
ncbi:tyrosine-protein phosphatase [Streptomyces profundus]|uniref:tyrosine-protein phosphatase n=1 Tax=Streptomyces profundus TaxID=2867410 RepID=UPI001D1657AD|nr:tyrosine-protein phosphatase [Streptomyces sp. MA3_2.13]UED84562.1 tyrosine-protein phosphatase [Streptomyces sp. MA3_2.13]